MAQTETSYFNLRPCDKDIGLTDPKPEPLKDMSIPPSENTTSIDTSYLHDLGLPSLPPLSQLLTSDEKAATIPACPQQMTTTSTNPVLQEKVQQQQQFYTTTSNSLPSVTTLSPVHTSLSVTPESTLSVTPSVVSAMTDSLGMMAPTSLSVTTAPLTMLMDPTSAAAAAAAMYLSPPQTELSGSNANTTTNAAAAAAAALMVNNAMLPSTGNPSTFYSMTPSTTSLLSTSSPSASSSSLSSPTNNNDTTPSSFMIPSNESMNPRDSIEKNYSFVAIPGANQRKRPRRRYDEIERLYHCTWPNCTKSYGTLNHLNAHVSMQKHGPKRHPSEFKEMRKNWRRQKKEREAAKKAVNKESLASSTMVNTTSMATGTTSMMQSLQSYNNHAPFSSMYASFPQPMSSISAFY